MGAEWPAGAALAMEQWPQRSRGFMSGVLQGSWGLGFLLSSACYWLLYDRFGWRGMLWIGIAPGPGDRLYPLLRQGAARSGSRTAGGKRRENREVRMPLAAIFSRGMLGNTLNACWFQCAGFVTYYSINALFATHLQNDLELSTALIATPLILANLFVFLASSSWGVVSDRIGRRWAMIIPAIVSLLIAPVYLLDQQHHRDRCRVHPAGAVRRRRHVRPDPGLSERAVPDRGPRDRDGVLLSRRRDRRRVGAAGADLFRASTGTSASPSRC